MLRNMASIINDDIKPSSIFFSHFSQKILIALTSNVYFYSVFFYFFAFRVNVDAMYNGIREKISPDTQRPSTGHSDLANTLYFVCNIPEMRPIMLIIIMDELAGSVFSTKLFKLILPIFHITPLEFHQR